MLNRKIYLIDDYMPNSIKVCKKVIHEFACELKDRGLKNKSFFSVSN